MTSAVLLLALAAPAFEPQACVPARWPTAAAESLALLEGSSINCLLLDEPQWRPEFLAAAHAKGLHVLAAASNAEALTRAAALGFDALVAEGDFDTSALAKTGRRVLALPGRARMDLDAKAPVIGTTQGVWPGIHLEKDGAVVAAPTGAPWIDTNAGFLRFVRTVVPRESAVWMANRPAAGQVLNGGRYVQALADAAMTGASWVLAFDPGFWAELEKRGARALADWSRINAALRFYQANAAFSAWPDTSRLLLVEDSDSGALYSGGFMDMIGARHIPATVIPPDRLPSAADRDVKLLLNIDPASLTDAQKEQVRAVARRGATIVNGPPGWKVTTGGGGITFDGSQVKQIDEAWREINHLIGRNNYGARVFGAPGMLSNLKARPDGKRLALFFVNYSGYAVDNISVYVLGHWSKAVLKTPQGDRPVDVYPVEEGTGMDLARVADVAILVVE
jgi:hypothetical protein